MTLSPLHHRAGDQGFLKQLNRSAILEMVRREPGISRADLALRTQLTKAAVGMMVQELLEQGWLIEGGWQQGSVGRPGRALHLNEGRHALLGAEVGVQGLRLVGCTLTGQILTHRAVMVPSTTPEATAQALASLLRELLRRPELSGREILGLGVAVPGPVALHEPTLLFAPNLGWRDVPFLSLLKPLLPDLGGFWLLENEAKAAAFGEVYFSEREEPELLAYISLGTGIGSGLMLGTPVPHLLRGTQGLAGEIGHSVLQASGLYCHCGNRGCAETLVSGWAIRAALGIPPGLLLEDALEARLQDVDVQVTLQRAGEALGMLLTNLHHTFNPSDIVIGGALTRLGGALLQPALTFFEKHQRHLYASAAPVRLHVRTDSTYIPARGAAAQVLSKVLHHPVVP
ncbi:ROK family transcriptional regulator [Deinococcus hopiensis]|uniref:Sugar kinase of the NBD/HSP70 family, may contain an N-terminal HTH domain n=1 Tax=Deinococcus hopiensis KR-140 TaxID=695939 RepID=A0A1W1VWK6_9DEIO|nr:ROK family transcriptional regulator [Deinococcus hopiensis]SMB97491.1 Sugar kinase of the NBD/HSP70 family, may contain an N-terminal HTH domain [Deinococcus hopiensis KR-140]